MRYSLLKVSLCLTVMLDLSAGAPLSAQHWPQFRGPSGQGHAPRSHPPVKFGEGTSAVENGDSRPWLVVSRDLGK
ncbi:MAG: hypothetical protein R3C12_11645 [Planctomycetaceae bacterium]